MPLDRGEFKVEDVHRTSNGQVTLSMGKFSFVGGLDTGIVPSALIYLHFGSSFGLASSSSIAMPNKLHGRQPVSAPFSIPSRGVLSMS